MKPKDRKRIEAASRDLVGVSPINIARARDMLARGQSAPDSALGNEAAKQVASALRALRAAGQLGMSLQEIRRVAPLSLGTPCAERAPPTSRDRPLPRGFRHASLAG